MDHEKASRHRESSNATLWYSKPAETWNESLPVGNGRLGAMVYGRTTTELLQLNEDSVYYGGRQERTPKQAFSNLAELRQLIRDGEHRLAEELVDLAFIPMPSCQRHFEPLATIKISFGHDESAVTDYRRSLDLLDGVTSVEYECEGVKWCRKVLASYGHEAIVVKIKSSQKAKFTIRLSRLGENEWDTNEFYDSMHSTDDKLVMRFSSGRADGIQSCCTVAASCDAQGLIKTNGGTLVVEALETYLVIAAHTSFRQADPTTAAALDVSKALQVNLARVWKSQVDSQNQLMSDMRLTLHRDDSHEEQKSTDDHISSPADSSLVELYHNHGRYLLVSSSRSSPSEPSLSLPSNLQGIWNSSFSPPWGCRFTININTQMNYWPCHIWGLSKCSDPLFYLLLRMAERGQQTASLIYGCKRPGAWCAHHNTDRWADTDPVDRWMPSGLWPLGGAWLCLHIWERYEFEGDADLLGDEPFLTKMLPVMEGAVLFLLDFLTEDRDGKFLVTSPSLSPENSYWTTNKANERVKGTLCEGSTMDVEIVRALFRAYLAAVATCEILTDTQLALCNEVKAALARLPPLKIGTDGRLLEWQQPYEETEPGHRHFSHLLPLYPGNAITASGTPELAEACRKTLQHRLAHGGGHTGWSRAWLICLYARLLDGEECLKHLQLMLSGSTLPNLFSSHPPMQIDGNFGACAGILEMMIQSHETEQQDAGPPRRIIRIFPACPVSWMSSGGRIEGIKARGGFRLTFQWFDSRVVMHSTVESQGREPAVVVIPGRENVVVPCKSGQWTLEQLRDRC